MNTMKKILCFCCLVLSLDGATRAAAAQFLKPTNRHIDLLFEEMAKDQKLRRNESVAQTFYVVRSTDAGQPILTYWPEARFLLRTENSEFAEPIPNNMRMATKFIDLEKDVAATREEIGSSNFIEAAADVIADVRKCLEGRRVTVATPPEPSLGSLDVVVLRVKPHALKYESNGAESDYDVVELRVETAGALANEVILIAIPAAGSALRQKLAVMNRLWPEWWRELATPANRLTLSVADWRGYLGAKRQKSPLAVIYTPGILDVQPKGR